ncbi:MAG: response regulator [Candidatus Zixiibacteriota bacterium]|nr:MAG: response regulator [candidate division Zixibacteria bacterium]
MTDAGKQLPRILAVDDEEIVLSFLTDALADEDCTLTVTASATDALEKLASESFDLLLTDVRMPDLDGIELTRRARELHPDLGVIYMTGYANLNSAKDAIKHGAIDYIMKPFELAEIRDAVRTAIEKTRTTDAGNSARQLDDLSTLSSMLFTAGDRKSLIVSTLRFAMIHQESRFGSALFYDQQTDRHTIVTLEEDNVRETSLATEPLCSCLKSVDLTQKQAPVVVTCLDDHPFFELNPDPNLKPYLCPDWLNDQAQAVIIPVIRGGTFYALITLELTEDTWDFSESAMRFYAITAGQLAITLENLALLEESRRSYTRLEQLSEETIELEKMAARGRMSAEIGHELNNFLGIIAASVSLLEVRIKKQETPELLQYTQKANDAVEKIRSFTSNLMDPPTGSKSCEQFHFDRMVPEVLEYILLQRRFRSIQLDIMRLDEDIPFVGDCTQIQQLLYNLFNNAADAVQEKGSGRIEVSVAREPQSGTFVLSVKDDGVGFEPQNLKRAFRERFTTKSGGHGFGLIVCARIIENHGGELSVDSIEGQGTTVIIRFPLAAAESEAAPPQPVQLPVTS